MLKESKTIVVKIGSSLLVDEFSGRLRMDFIYHLMNDIAFYHNQGHKMVVVSSGSVALGRRYSGIPSGTDLTLAQKQASAALGQPVLMAAYQNFAAEHDLRTAQILITLHDFEDRKRFLNAEDTLEELLSQGTIPIVNENDTVATKHLRVGDNDRLSAKVAQLVEADELVILTDVDGLWDRDKNIVEKIETLDESIFDLAGGATGPGTGGMVTKLLAAEIASASGCTTHITTGHGELPIRNAIEDLTLHTTIQSGTTPENARHLWIATSLDIQGSVEISPETVTSLQSVRSILPADIIDVVGTFGRGDIISITSGKNEFARGIVAFNHHEVQALIQNRKPDIFSVLGYNTRPDIVHKNDLAIL